MAYVKPDDLIQLPGGQWVAAGLAGPTVDGRVKVNDDTIVKPAGSGNIPGQRVNVGVGADGQFTYAPGGPRDDNPIYGTPAPASSLQGPASSSTPQAPRRDFAAEAALLFPWVPAALRSVFVDAYTRFGDANLALAAIRQDSHYDQYFAGNRRADGTVYLSEGEYLSTMEGYDRQLASFGLNPANYGQRKIQALQNGRSPDELGAAVGKQYLGIVTKGDSYREYYAQKYGNGDLSNTALLDAALDGTISPYEAERRISSAQVGGAAKMFGFDIARQEAERLQSFGLTDEAARTLYSKAKTEIPTLNSLAQRFNDPADPLTAEHYADALVLNDPEELKMIGRLYARDKAQYGAGGGLFNADQSGAQGGLLAR